MPPTYKDRAVLPPERWRENRKLTSISLAWLVANNLELGVARLPTGEISQSLNDMGIYGVYRKPEI